ncbi:MAG: amino acid--[acyl-carrier-protein] ligase [Hyphomicrobiales bacterium]
MNVAVRNNARQDAFEPKGSEDELRAALFHEMSVEGVYARTALYEEVVERLSSFITRRREPKTEVMRFPPVMSRRHLEKAGYLKSFPNLLGCVCALHGADADIHSAVRRFEAGGDWTSSLAPADLVLTPAACYPVYPLAAGRGPVPKGGLRFDVACDCFRREPSRSIDRLQSFRMREYVCIGSPDEVNAFRERWIERGLEMASELMLPCKIDQASDPFFGRTGQMMAISQLQQSLKFELLVPLRSAERPTACMSFNNHRDHFGEVWGLRNHAGELSHTGCAAFGMDRLAVALFWTHGLDIEAWPASVREALALG